VQRVLFGERELWGGVEVANNVLFAVATVYRCRHCATDRPGRARLSVCIKERKASVAETDCCSQHMVLAMMIDSLMSFIEADPEDAFCVLEDLCWYSLLR